MRHNQQQFDFNFPKPVPSSSSSPALPLVKQKSSRRPRPTLNVPFQQSLDSYIQKNKQPTPPPDDMDDDEDDDEPIEVDSEEEDEDGNNDNITMTDTDDLPPVVGRRHRKQQMKAMLDTIISDIDRLRLQFEDGTSYHTASGIVMLDFRQSHHLALQQFSKLYLTHQSQRMDNLERARSRRKEKQEIVQELINWFKQDPVVAGRTCFAVSVKSSDPDYPVEKRYLRLINKTRHKQYADNLVQQALQDIASQPNQPETWRAIWQSLYQHRLKKLHSAKHSDEDLKAMLNGHEHMTKSAMLSVLASRITLMELVAHRVWLQVQRFVLESYDTVMITDVPEKQYQTRRSKKNSSSEIKVEAAPLAPHSLSMERVEQLLACERELRELREVNSAAHTQFVNGLLRPPTPDDDISVIRNVYHYLKNQPNGKHRVQLTYSTGDHATEFYVRMRRVRNNAAMTGHARIKKKKLGQQKFKQVIDDAFHEVIYNKQDASLISTYTTYVQSFDDMLQQLTHLQHFHGIMPLLQQQITQLHNTRRQTVEEHRIDVDQEDEETSLCKKVYMSQKLPKRKRKSTTTDADTPPAKRTRM
jgi:hypothetical protein